MQILALKPPHFTFCILYVETRVLTKTTTFIPECELKVALGNNHYSVLREWILENREVKSEMKICFTHFEK